MNVQTITKFAQEVRDEMRRISWPTLKDTRTMALMVFVLVFIIGLFLVLTDLAIGAALAAILGLQF